MPLHAPDSSFPPIEDESFRVNRTITCEVQKGILRDGGVSEAAEHLGLAPAGGPDRGVCRMRDGGILKMVAGKGRLSRACAVYEAVSAAYEAGAAIARPGELVQAGSGYAMTFEFVEGPFLKDLVVRRQISPDEAGEMLARCLLGLHALHGDETRMRDVRNPFLNMVDNIAPWLSESTAEVCRHVVSSMPPATTLIHGDVHTGNVIVRGNGELVLIDADTVSMGSPIFDLACTFQTLICEAVIDPRRAEAFHGMPAEDVRVIWKSFLSCYYAESSEKRSELTDCQVELIAWMVLLNRLKSCGRGNSPFGESALQILQAIGRLSKALRRMQDAAR